MEGTIFLKKFINFLKYDKFSINSLPFVLSILLCVLVLSDVFNTMLIEQDGEVTLVSIKVILEDIVMYFCIIEHSLNPEKKLKLIELVENDFMVDKSEYTGKSVEKWERLEKFFNRKRKDMEATSKYISMFMLFLCLGVINRNVFNTMLGMKPGSKGSEGWMTPFPSHTPPDSDPSAFFVYAFTLQTLIVVVLGTEGFFIQNTVCLSTDRIVADFETIYLLLDDLTRDFGGEREGEMCGTMGEREEEMYGRMGEREEEMYGNIEDREGVIYRKIADREEEMYKIDEVALKKDMHRIVKCHQNLLRNFRLCATNSAFSMSVLNLVILNDSCYNAYFMLTSNDVKRTVYYGVLFTLVNLTVFFVYRNGQRIFNQNQILRQSITQLPWTDKPRWFRQTVCIMMTRANVDTEMKPYGIYLLNYMAFKDLMKFAFSVGNVLYSKKLANQSQAM
ncbi:uncharacterized protein LOC111046124 isoform X2 [Nilaparvata lugens]|nr:uncharacterized protein LOC111046124 isoform X2 [Nilaparvata lugens]